jgi:hypothetical protein
MKLNTILKMNFNFNLLRIAAAADRVNAQSHS